MKTYGIPLTTCIILFCSAILFAQQGNVVSGGDATGTGGSLSYSVGQTDYLMYSSEQATFSLGLQQVWLESTIVVPPTLEVQNTLVAENDILCFNATETVALAGDGTFFIIEPGGSAEIIAGQNILLRYGTNIHSGADFHAWITTNDDYCNLQTSLLASLNEEVPVKQSIMQESIGNFFKVYPNPTTGIFTLELLEELKEFSTIQLKVYTMQGHLIFSNELPVQQCHTLSLAERQPGIYLVRVLQNNNIGIAKIIKQ